MGKKHSKAVINTIGKSINMDIIQIIIGYCKRSIPLKNGLIGYLSLLGMVGVMKGYLLWRI